MYFCTRFREGRRARKWGKRGREFFEILRPAQASRGRRAFGMPDKEQSKRGAVRAAMRGRGPDGGGTRDTEKDKEKYNITTKSLILAQDER